MGHEAIPLFRDGFVNTVHGEKIAEFVVNSMVHGPPGAKGGDLDHGQATTDFRAKVHNFMFHGP